MPVSALCPICKRKIPTLWWGTRLIFEHHAFSRRGTRQPCEGSGWLVEDEDIENGKAGSKA